MIVMQIATAGDGVVYLIRARAMTPDPESRRVFLFEDEREISPMPIGRSSEVFSTMAAAREAAQSLNKARLEGRRLSIHLSWRAKASD